VTQGDATGPQPGQGFAGHLREDAAAGLGSRRLLSLPLLFGKAFVAGHFTVEVALDEVVEVARGHG
jgi:hypothetical protein